MLRIISNMSDANRYSASQIASQEIRDVGSFLQEVFDKAQGLVTHTGITLTFSGLSETIYCLVDSEKLERAVLNILSNAIKFTPKGGTIEASLTRRGNMLYLTVLDSGSGIPENIKGTIHSRYLRGPVLDEGRFGIGLGMVLIRSAATQHGGTVLIDQPGEPGTRITMTLAIRQNQSGTLRSNIHRFDYAGERDHSLLELSGNLPHALYDTKKIN
jgi:signal transduction histidine kinase